MAMSAPITVDAALSFASVLEVVESAGTEIAMFFLAAMVYAVFAHSRLPIGGGKSKAKKTLSPPGSPPLSGSGGGRDRVAAGEEKKKASPRPASTEGSNKKAAAVVDDAASRASAIKAHARNRDLAAARQVFESHCAATVGQESPQPLVHNAFLDALVQCGPIKEASIFFREMEKNGLSDLVSFNTIIKAHLNSHDHEQARALMKEMSAKGLQANRVTYNELLNALVTAKDRQGAWRLIDEMRDAGVAVGPVTISILLKSLTAQSLPKDVQRTMALVEDLEEKVDEVLFSAVIDACTRLWSLGSLTSIMQRFKERGNLCTLSAPTYGSMIKAYGQAGNIGQAWCMWREMEKCGVKPTAVALGCMVEAAVASSQAQQAYDLLRETLASEDQERRKMVNTVIYSTVLKGFAVQKQTDKVFAVYDEMRAQGVTCNTITYNTMLDACAKNGAMSRAEGLLKDMAKDSVEPDVITYSTIVKGYCGAGELDRAFSVLAEMKSKGKLSPDEIMYNSLLDGCTKQQRTEDALKLLKDMEACGITPSNYTASILVKLLGRAKKVDKAVQMVEDLSRRHNFKPNMQVYTCLIQACLNSRQLEQAVSFLKKMAAEGCHGDAFMYNVLVKGCLQQRAPLRAAEVVRAASGLPGPLPPAKQSGGKGGGRGAGGPPGIEAPLLREVLETLRRGGKSEQEAGEALAAALQPGGGAVRPRSSQAAGGVASPPWRRA